MVPRTDLACVKLSVEVLLKGSGESCLMGTPWQLMYDGKFAECFLNALMPVVHITCGKLTGLVCEVFVDCTTLSS